MRIQNAMIQELNKIAMIHLHILGYSDEDIRDYKLTLNNPSTQSKILEIEAFTQKVDLYVKLTTSNETGLKPMSETNAKKLVFGLSADEILDDVKQQMIENVVGPVALTHERLAKFKKNPINPARKFIVKYPIV